MNLSWHVLAILLVVVLLMASPSTAPLVSSGQPPIDATTYYVSTTVQPRRVDPARAYDTASMELIFNVYEPLIFFSDKRVLPSDTTNVSAWGYSDLSMFAPMLAESMPTISSDRLNWTFTIRSGVKWQPWRAANGTWVTDQILTAEDVEYTFERMLVQDMYGSPSWMLNLRLTGYMVFAEFDVDPTTNAIEPIENETAVGQLIDNAITRNGNNVTFYLKEPFPETAFMQILAQTYGCVVNKAFCIEHGCWNGTFYPGWSGDYRKMPSITYSPLDMYYSAKSKYSSSNPEVPAMCGTGPYKFTYLNKTALEWRIDKFDNYWSGWSGNHLNTIIVKGVADWFTRKTMFFNGELDSIQVSRKNMSELLLPGQPYTPFPGIILYYDAPALTNNAMFFNFHVREDSPWMPKIQGIDQPYFFANIHIRRAFAHALNFSAFIENVWSGDAIHGASWWLKGLVPDYENKALIPHDIDIDMVEAELKEGGVWETGFETYLCYDAYSTQPKIVYEMIRDTIQSLNSKRNGLPEFKVNVIALYRWLEEPEDYEWSPAFLAGWLADFADPDNFVRPYMHSQGDFVVYQSYWNDTVDAKIDAAVRMPNGDERNMTYQELQYIYWLDIPSLPLAQSLSRFWLRTWVRGWYYNPLYPGFYFYDLYKEMSQSPVSVDVSVVTVEFSP